MRKGPSSAWDAGWTEEIRNVPIPRINHGCWAAPRDRSRVAGADTGRRGFSVAGTRAGCAACRSHVRQLPAAVAVCGVLANDTGEDWSVGVVPTNGEAAAFRGGDDGRVRGEWAALPPVTPRCHTSRLLNPNSPSDPAATQSRPHMSTRFSRNISLNCPRSTNFNRASSRSGLGHGSGISVSRNPTP